LRLATLRLETKEDKMGIKMTEKNREKSWCGWFRHIDSNWYGKHFQYKVRWKGYNKEHDEWIFRDDLEEDLGQEGLAEYEGDFFKVNPTAKRHTDIIKERTKGKCGFSKKK
jgi:hypothetical protein